MKLVALRQKYPLITVLAALAVVNAATLLSRGSGLGEQVAGTALGAVIALVMGYALAPVSFDGRLFPDARQGEGAEGENGERAVDGRSERVGEGRAEGERSGRGGAGGAPARSDLVSVVGRIALAGAAGGVAVALCAWSNIPVFAPLDFFAEHSWSDALSLSATDVAQRVMLIVLFCAVTALLEEAFFRGLVVPCAFDRAVREVAAHAEGRSAITGAGANSAGSSAPAVTWETRTTWRSAAPGAPSSVAPAGRPAARSAVAPDENPLVIAAVFSALIFAIMHLPLASAAGAAGAGTADFASIALLMLQVFLKFAQAALFGLCMAALFVRTGTIWLAALAHAAFDLLYFCPFLLTFAQVPGTYLTGNLGDVVVLALTVIMLVPPAAHALRWLFRS